MPECACSELREDCPGLRSEGCALAIPLPKKPPLRVEMLSEGIKLTAGDRDAEYGDPKQNMSCAGELKATIRRYMVRDITPAELEALDMVLTKMSRVVTGPKVKGDTYVDGAVYFSIAGEMALRASEGQAVTASEEAPTAPAQAVAKPSYRPTSEELRWALHSLATQDAERSFSKSPQKAEP